jgi:hypothetical protein
MAIVLKGNLLAGDIINITFFGDTVAIGEKHIVTTSVICEIDPIWHQFSTRDALFSLNDLETIIDILNNQSD